MNKVQCASWDDLRSDRALVCHREINSDHGNATVYSVLLSDGFLLECGLNPLRAEVLAAIINEAGPDRLSRAALQAA